MRDFFVTQGRSNNNDVQLSEFRMKSKETATKLRKKFDSLKKSGKDFRRVNISHCVHTIT
jgi:hypothetical protein